MGQILRHKAHRLQDHNVSVLNQGTLSTWLNWPYCSNFKLCGQSPYFKIVYCKELPRIIKGQSWSILVVHSVNHPWTSIFQKRQRTFAELKSPLIYVEKWMVRTWSERMNTNGTWESEPIQIAREVANWEESSGVGVTISIVQYGSPEHRSRQQLSHLILVASGLSQSVKKFLPDAICDSVPGVRQ